MLECNNIFDNEIRVDKDKHLPSVTLDDMNVRVRHLPGDKVHRDVDCNSVCTTDAM